MKTNLSNEIIKIRKALGIPQRVMAENVGVTRQIIADYESGRTKLPLGIYNKILSMRPDPEK